MSKNYFAFGEIFTDVESRTFRLCLSCRRCLSCRSHHAGSRTRPPRNSTMRKCLPPFTGNFNVQCIRIFWRRSKFRFHCKSCRRSSAFSSAPQLTFWSWSEPVLARHCSYLRMRYYRPTRFVSNFQTVAMFFFTTCKVSQYNAQNKIAEATK